MKPLLQSKVVSSTLYTFYMIVLAAFLLGLAGGGAHATEASDVRAGLKILLQTAEKPPDASLIAVLYNANDPASKADADSIAASINNGSVTPPGLKLTAQAMTVSSYDWAAHPKAAFLAQGLPPDSFAQIAKISARIGALSMSADLACVKADQCVIGVLTRANVEIYYSPAAAEATHVTLAPALIMLANQV